jgi:tRNA(Leu) C34 or U34 (ribose-2'-O)-methylase TrmL
LPSSWPAAPHPRRNIGRTCVATGTKLHLIEPLGFSLSEKHLKRAGMDYWKDLDVTTYIDYNDFLEKNPEKVQEWFNRAQYVRKMSDSLYQYVDELKLKIMNKIGSFMGVIDESSIKKIYDKSAKATMEQLKQFHESFLWKSSLKKENGLPKLNNATDALYHMFAQ